MAATKRVMRAIGKKIGLGGCIPYFEVGLKFGIESPVWNRFVFFTLAQCADFGRKWRVAGARENIL